MIYKCYPMRMLPYGASIETHCIWSSRKGQIVNNYTDSDNYDTEEQYIGYGESYFVESLKEPITMEYSYNKVNGTLIEIDTNLDILEINGNIIEPNTDPEIIKTYFNEEGIGTFKVSNETLFNNTKKEEKKYKPVLYYKTESSSIPTSYHIVSNYTEPLNECSYILKMPGNFGTILYIRDNYTGIDYYSDDVEYSIKNIYYNGSTRYYDFRFPFLLADFSIYYKISNGRTDSVRVYNYTIPDIFYAGFEIPHDREVSYVSKKNGEISYIRYDQQDVNDIILIDPNYAYKDIYVTFEDLGPYINLCCNKVKIECQFYNPFTMEYVPYGNNGWYDLERDGQGYVTGEYLYPYSTSAGNKCKLARYITVSWNQAEHNPLYYQEFGNSGCWYQIYRYYKTKRNKSTSWKRIWQCFSDGSSKYPFSWEIPPLNGNEYIENIDGSKETIYPYGLYRIGYTINFYGESRDATSALYIYEKNKTYSNLGFVKEEQIDGFLSLDYMGAIDTYSLTTSWGDTNAFYRVGEYNNYKYINPADGIQIISIWNAATCSLDGYCFEHCDHGQPYCPEEGCPWEGCIGECTPHGGGCTSDGGGCSDDGDVCPNYTPYLYSKIGKVNGTGGLGLYIRRGPGTNYDTVGGLNEGDTVTIYGETSGWYNVGNGWCSSSYITTTGYA